ncbi:MAG: T9SS type A sorting domain-containing protein [Flavobacteriaceae bacterium]|nr:T9SS type A sorting domain-containing protein [Flavobacteriaceae bacterium]
MKTKLFLALLFISSIAFAQFPTNGLIGEYSFTAGSLADGANGNNFTQTGTALTTLDDRFASANDAINLGGDYLTRTNIDYPNSGEYRDIGTVSFWIKTTTNSSDTKVIIDDTDRSNITDTQWAGYHVYLKDGKVGVAVMVRYNVLGYRGFGVLSPQIISDGNWHHVAITMNNRAHFSGSVTIVSAGVALYVDGVAAGNTGVSNASTGFIQLTQTNDSPGNVTIGNNRGNNFPTINRYEDTIDDLLFYGRSLSPTEIASIANYNFCFAIDTSTITISNATTTSFDVSWQENGDFELAYVLSGQPLASATVIPVNGYTSGNLENISGLTEGTFYDIYIREVCTATLYSAWSNALPARTLGKIFVKADATGANNGNSWADAYTDLQDALAISEYNQEIWVAEGIYKPHTSDRSIYFEITKNGTKIYGGFDGTETQLSQRDFRVNETILSGDLLGNDNTNVVLNEATRSDNTAKIIHVNAHNFTLDGVTISDAEGFIAGNAFYESGAALTKQLLKNNLTIENCIIKNNTAYKAGAAILAVYGTSGFLKVTNTVFSNNLAGYGTAFYSYTVGATTLDVDITNCLFNDNVATDIGSSLGFAGSAGWFRAHSAGSTVTASFVNNTYTNNKDDGTGGGLNNFTRATLGISRTSGNMIANVDNCIFYNNEASGTATARSITGILATLPNNITVTNSIDENNFAAIPAGNTTNTSNVNPLFTNSLNDFTLQTGSPAIDTGDNSKVPASLLTDLLGNARIFNTTVDMGVYEFGSPVYTTYSLTTSVSGNGSVSPSGTTTYTAGTVVEITATPDTGWVFSHWLGDASGSTNPVNVTINANSLVEAVFVEERTLTTNTVGNGSVSPNGTTIYNDGTLATITATPDTGWQFDSWTGDAVGSLNPISITMDADKTVTANFSQIQYELTIIENNGTVTPDSGTLTGGVYVYNAGTVVEITATPASGYSFVSFDITDSSGTTTDVTNPLSIIMNDHMVIEATFSLIPTHELTTNTIGSGSVSPSGTTTHNENDIVAVVATPATGYQFDSWTGDSTSTNPSINITMNSDKVITANFSQIQHSLTVNVIGNGSVTPNSGTYNYGTVLSLVPTADTGWQFDGWSGDASGTANPLSVIMDSDKVITATFSQIEYELTIMAVNGTAIPDIGVLIGGVYTYNAGTTVEITATPASGYNFISFEITDSNGTTTDATNPLSITMNDHITVEAIFNLLGLEDALFSSLSIYPNPTQNILNIRTDTAFEKVEIYNLLGVKLIENNSKTLDVSKLPSGVYLIKITNEEGSYITKRFVKE